ncbi:MAG TPA: ABC transporter permease [Puia sp.]|nr:ABC transporter permease [Puia sp.]
MLRNYFIIALRNFMRNKVFSLINVLGLSIGISASLVIFLIVHYELSYDKFEPQRNLIYRIVMDFRFNKDQGHGHAVPAPLGKAISEEITGVDQTVPLFQFQGDATAKVAVVNNNPGKPIVYKKQANTIFTNNDYFKMISYDWLAGSPQIALQKPFQVILTESRAKQYFPSLPISSILGKEIIYNDSVKTYVTGIVKDIPYNTYFDFKEFISLPTVLQLGLKDDFMMDKWTDWMGYSQLFVKLSPNSSPARIEPQLKKLLAKYNPDALKDSTRLMSFKLQALSNVHFNSDYGGGVGHRIAHLPTLYGLLAISGFLLLLGCINFINLTTAQASQRAKEIGIRKTMGSSKKQLVIQFLGETLLMTTVATVLSVIITPILLKIFAYYVPEGLHYDLFHQPFILLFLIVLIFAVSFFAGLYPSLILSGFKPAMVLKKQAFANSSQTRNAWLRKTLTVSQFVIAQFFVIATFIAVKQIHYSINKDMGFKKDAIIFFHVPFDTTMSRRYALLNELKYIPEIQIASIGFLPPAIEGAAFSDIKYIDGKKEIQANVQVRWGDSNYLKLYQIKLVAGRYVQQSDTLKEIMINEAYAKQLGFQNPEDVAGKQLNMNHKNVPIVGVLHDFNEGSLHAPIGPLAFYSFNLRSFNFHIALKPQNADGTLWQDAIKKIENSYKKIYPDNDFNYSFFDESIAKFYESEQRISALLKWAAALAIFISCLGLLGLVMYTTNVRTKEIGIRKILGASVSQIVSMLSKDFLSLVVIAFLIAAPIAWWAGSTWLDNFAYRTNMNWWVFALSGAGMIIIALLTLSIRTIQAAIANPVDALVNE